MNLGLEGKRVLVAGASRGIGRAIAEAFLSERAQVLAVARGADGLAQLAQQLGSASLATASADITTADGAKAAVAATVAAFGGIDIVVCNVGKSFARTIADMTDEDFANSLDMNLWGAKRVTSAALPYLRESNGGAITFISSIWGREAGGAPGYNVAKAGVQALAKAYARELAQFQIRVNSVAPGSILFEGGGWDRRQKADPTGIADFVKHELPFGRFGAPQEVADVVTFVSSPRASWVSGAAIVVDGCQSRAF